MRETVVYMRAVDRWGTVLFESFEKTLGAYVAACRAARKAGLPLPLDVLSWIFAEHGGEKAQLVTLDGVVLREVSS